MPRMRDVGMLNRISLSIIRSPLVWGGVAALALYAPLRVGWVQSPFVSRYLMNHWVLYTEVVMFFVGLAALLIKALGIFAQRVRLRRPVLAGESVVAPSEAARLLDEVDRLHESIQDDYLARRIRSALVHVMRTGSAARMDDELKHLADVDADRAHAAGALVRFVIWAVPILGFLGTVIGITDAIASLSPEQLENSLNAVTSGLGVAFDTTALALVLSMILMFVNYRVDQSERALLEQVDQHAVAALAGRFKDDSPVDADPHVAVVHRMAEEVVSAQEWLIQRQAAVWQAALEGAQEQWRTITTASQEAIEHAFSAALSSSLANLGHEWAAAQERLAEQSHAHWARVQTSLENTADASRGLLTELGRQAEVQRHAVQATVQVTKLHEALNDNLASLAVSQHLEETLLNLTAAVHLLNARLSQTHSIAPLAERKEASVASRAA